MQIELTVFPSLEMQHILLQSAEFAVEVLTVAIVALSKHKSELGLDAGAFAMVLKVSARRSHFLIDVGIVARDSGED